MEEEGGGVREEGGLKSQTPRIGHASLQALPTWTVRPESAMMASLDHPRGPTKGRNSCAMRSHARACGGGLVQCEGGHPRVQLGRVPSEPLDVNGGQPSVEGAAVLAHEGIARGAGATLIFFCCCAEPSPS